MPFPPSRRDAGLIAALRELLTGACYRDETVAGLLGLRSLAALSSSEFGVRASRLEHDAGPLPMLTRLFVLEQRMRRRDVERALGRHAVGCLERLGLLAARACDTLAAEVIVSPCDGAFVVTDRRVPPRAGSPARAQDRVMYLGADSYLLAYLAPSPRAGDSVLDLCTGSGVHAILAARQGARAIGVDINPRAVAFARFNAALNGVEPRCTFLTGDLYRPLAGRREGPMGLVLANPPFVASACRGAARTVFRDAGLLGDDVLARIVRGVERRLAPCGLAACVSSFTDTLEQPFEARLARWLGSRPGLDASLCITDSASPAELADAHASRAGQRSGSRWDSRRRRWLAALHGQRVVRVRGGLLVLGPGGGSGRVRTDAIDYPERPDRLALPALAASRSAANRLGGLRWLRVAARVGAGVVAASANGLDSPLLGVSLVTLRGRLGVAREITPLLGSVVGLLDGRRPIGAAVDAAAAARGVSALRLALDLEEGVLDLLACGLIEPLPAVGPAVARGSPTADRPTEPPPHAPRGAG